MGALTLPLLPRGCCGLQRCERGQAGHPASNPAWPGDSEKARVECAAGSGMRCWSRRQTTAAAAATAAAVLSSVAFAFRSHG
eukprot:353534-Chlamydomonas_euryale.AAC.2